MMAELVQIFKALADPTRLQMVGLMVGQRRCGRELAAELGVSAPTVSHHLGILRGAGLLVETRESPYSYFELDLAMLQKQLKRVSDKRAVQKLAAGDGLDKQKRRVLETFFDGEKLTRIPAQRRKKEIVLEEILRRLPRKDSYTEKQLSRHLAAFHEDFCTIRREFIMGKYMERDKGRYQLASRGKAALLD